MSRASVDIETACGVVGCKGFGLGANPHCEHAVHFKLNRIDLIGVYDGKTYSTFRDVHQFDRWLAKLDHDGKAQLVFHNGKFDIKTLWEKGAKNLRSHHFVSDTLLGATIHPVKVSEKWLAIYEAQRKKRNEALPKGSRHRAGNPHSLKVLAPFFLSVDKFWENPLDHNDPSYNRKDCQYTYDLDELFRRAREENGTSEFYDRLMGWNRMLLEAEFEGVLVDVDLLRRMLADGKAQAEELRRKTLAQFRDAATNRYQRLRADVVTDYRKKCEAYISNRVKNKNKIPEVQARYATMTAKAVARIDKEINLNSHQQMTEVLSYYNVDTSVSFREKELNEWVEKEKANKYVIKRAVAQGKKELETLLQFKEKETEVRYLQGYLEALVGRRIYSSFNIVTRTGRLSSSGPNLQNVKGQNKAPFIVADAKRFIIYSVDSSQIEPRLVAYFTEDPQLVELFQDGRDYHNYATKRFFPKETKGVKEKDIKDHHAPLRRTAKTGDLSIIYGTGANTFAAMLLLREGVVVSEEDAQRMVNDFRKGMGHVTTWKKNFDKDLEEGVEWENLLGRPLSIPKDNIYMTGFNTLIQGSASDLILHASWKARERFKKEKIDAKPLTWVHDSVVWRFPRGKEEYCKQVVDEFMNQGPLHTTHGIVPLACEGELDSRMH